MLSTARRASRNLGDKQIDFRDWDSFLDGIRIIPNQQAVIVFPSNSDSGVVYVVKDGECQKLTLSE